MFDIVLYPRAETDLADIWQFTFETWGVTQANTYLEQLDLGFRQLAKNPKLGKPCDEIRTGYRCLHLNRHMAYYRLHARQVIIVRVLHERMDIWQHLND
ncbi:MAG: type II toxin-antitoxin system RelE/ParE family toxin [Nitrospira sp.]|jgi:toxin ParE1/3/4